MKAASVVVCWAAIIAVLLGAYLTNIGQEMTVRVGGLSGDDLHRLPSPAILAEARAATASTDQKKIMSAVHTIMNTQLMLLLLTSFSAVTLVLVSWRRSARQPAQRNLGGLPLSNDSPPSTPPPALTRRS